MKKRFLKIALLSLVCAAMPMSFTSCKDYDDDITNINENAGDLQKQITALNQAIEQYKGEAAAAKAAAEQAAKDAAAAKQAGDDALAAANEAKQLASLAEAAAKEAKAEAIAEVKAWAEQLFANKADKTEIQKLADRIAAIEEKLNQLGQGGSGETPDVPNYDDAIAALQTQIDALNKYKDLLESLGTVNGDLDKLNEELGKVNQAIQSINDKMSGLASSSSVTEISNTLTNVINDVKNIQASLLTLQSDQLTSLVFKPTFYYHGIEAMWAPTFVFPKLTVQPVNADKYTPEDAPDVGDSVRMTPDLVATYHINPSSAAVPENIANYSFKNTINDLDYSRAENTGVPTPTIYKKEVKDGMLTVHANLKDGMIKYIQTNSKVTVLALQVKVDDSNAADTVVTSDYAALKALYTRDLVLANASQPAHQAHWPTTMQAAIKSPDAIEIEWNGEGVDVAKYVQTHYSTDAAQDIQWDVNALSGTVEKSGFKYSYDLVGYTLGQNKTSESAHAALKGSWIRPQMTVDGFQQPFGSAQGEASIDREPIVRVLLTDTVSNAVAAVGYIKFRIVPDTKDNIVTVIPAFNFTTGYTANCPLQAFSDKLSWHQVEEKIIETLNISKHEFETDYKPDFATPVNMMETQVKELAQYNNTTETATELSKPNRVGEVGMTLYDDEATETNVIKWNIDGDKAFEIFAKNRQTSTSVIVRFTKTIVVNSSSTHPQTIYHYVYVTLNWTPDPLNVDPKGEISNNLKIKEMWYSAWSNNHDGFDEVHMNVAVPEEGSTNSSLCTFDGHLTYPWVHELRLGVTGVDPIYTGYQEPNLTKSFNFTTPDQLTAVGVSGNEYTLSGNGLNLQATFGGKTETIATISTNNTTTFTTWEVDDPTVTYSNTSLFAKDILNKWASDNLEKGQTVAGKIMLTAVNEPCKNNLPLTNNTYNLRFLRPVNMYVADGASMVDAKNSGSTVKLADYLSFKDWRADDPMSFFSTHVNYFQYYGFTKIGIGTLVKGTTPGVEIVNADPNDSYYPDVLVTKVVTTNLNGNDIATKKLNEVTPHMELVYKPATTIGLNDMGTLTYYNNGETINKAFKVRVPIIVEYKWGWLYGTMDITINPTLGQG